MNKFILFLLFAANSSCFAMNTGFKRHEHEQKLKELKTISLAMIAAKKCDHHGYYFSSEQRLLHDQFQQLIRSLYEEPKKQHKHHHHSTIPVSEKE